MLLAAATLTWILSIYDGPLVVSTESFQTEEECRAALEEYQDQFTDHEDRVRHHADCALPATDTME